MSNEYISKGKIISETQSDENDLMILNEISIAFLEQRLSAPRDRYICEKESIRRLKSKLKPSSCLRGKKSPQRHKENLLKLRIF